LTELNSDTELLLSFNEIRVDAVQGRLNLPLIASRICQFLAAMVGEHHHQDKP